MLHTIADFDRDHSDEISKALRPAAQKVPERGDKRLEGWRSHREMLDRAFSIAWLELPQNKMKHRPAEILAERDQARNEGLVKKVSQRMATL